jgi:hypothetical protein
MPLFYQCTARRSPSASDALTAATAPSKAWEHGHRAWLIEFGGGDPARDSAMRLAAWLVRGGRQTPT